MIVRVQTGDVRQAPTVHSGARSTIVYTDAGAPVAIYLQMPNGSLVQHTANEPGFAAALEELGFDKRNIPDVKRELVDHTGKTRTQ